MFFENGIKSNYEIFFKNINSIGRNDVKYKNSPQSELMSTYAYNVSLPMVKKTNTNFNTLEPKLSLRFSPHQMKNHEKTSSRLSLSNVFTNNRLGLDDSYEERIKYGDPENALA